jgi:hypothetical protein
MKKLIKIVIAVCVLFLLQSCYYDTVYTVEAPPVDPDVDILYKTQIQPIWENNCVDCHKGNVAPDLRADNSYDALINGEFVLKNNSAGSILYKSVAWNGGAAKMPIEYKLTESEIQLIQLWIDQGAENN